MKYPPKLKTGDTIGLICPSSAVSQVREDECKVVLGELGYRVKMADNLTLNLAGYMAGDGEIRGKWINAMFADPEVDAIFCVRGGDGGSRAMEYVDLDLIRDNPKIFLGYSDVTSMHSAIANHCGFVTFHGPMISSNMVEHFDDESKESLFHALNADEEYVFQNPQDHEIKVLKEGQGTGRLTGGNLAIMCASIGTPYEIDTKGKILFIEEVGEPMNSIDRLAYQLRNSNKFKDCAGVILGQFTDCSNSYQPDYIEIDVFTDALRGYDIPVLYNVRCGHDFPNMTLPLGACCTIDSATRQITFGKPERIKN